jgi:hypothetical protein
LQRRFGKPDLRKLKLIAIDEIAIGKGHRYLTIVLDLLAGAVVGPFMSNSAEHGATDLPATLSDVTRHCKLPQERSCAFSIPRGLHLRVPTQTKTSPVPYQKSCGKLSGSHVLFV